VPTPRSRPQRRRDTEHRLTHDIDVWVASASADGAPYLVPLSFDWDGEALLVATPTDSPTGRNLATTRTVRLGLGATAAGCVGLTPRPGAPRGPGSEAPRAEAKENQTYCSKLVRSSQARPTETAKAAPPTSRT
jgi:hypothetical protein